MSEATSPSSPAHTNRFTLLRRLFARLLIWGVRFSVLGVVVALLLLLALHVLFLPRINQYKAWVAEALSTRIGQAVHIEHLEADWEGLAPRLKLKGFELSTFNSPPSTPPNFRLDSIDMVLAWRSIWGGKIHFRRVMLHEPVLRIERTPQGQLTIAGVQTDDAPGDGAPLAWLFSQQEMGVSNGTLIWQDQLRHAPPLALNQVDMHWQSRARVRRLDIKAQPAEALGKNLDLRIEITQGHPAQPETWAGSAYVDVQSADLGGWKTWVDYPVPLLGQGSLSVQLDFAQQHLLAGVAQFELHQVRTQLAPELPEMAFQLASGRIAGQWSPESKKLEIKNLQITKENQASLGPIDLSWHETGEGATQSSLLSANHLDFSELGELAHRLPLPEAWHKQWSLFSPKGAVDDLQFTWLGSPSEPKDWSIRADIQHFSSQAVGAIPGLSGLNGHIEGTSQRGVWQLSGQDAALSLPKIMPQADIALNKVQAQGAWSRIEGAPLLEIKSLVFENQDAAGNAHGSYQVVPGTPGKIDLYAQLTRAEGAAVWRYMPWAVNVNTRQWIKESILGGRSTDVHFRLQGDLYDFPFEKPSSTGQFWVQANILGGKLDCAPGWPIFENIEGNLRFEKAGMHVYAEKATVMGVKLTDTLAHVPDFIGDEILTVSGKATGDSAQMLNYTRHSPVVEKVGPFLDYVRAQGDAVLDLKLVMPLRRIPTTQIEGNVAFQNNTVRILDELPSLTALNGSLSFTENDLSFSDLQGQFLGQPVQIKGQTHENNLQIEANSYLDASALSAYYPQYPWLQKLNGQTPVALNIEADAHQADLHITSSTEGLAFNFPAPFVKNPVLTWPLDMHMYLGSTWRSTGQMGDILKWAVSKEGTKPALKGQINVGESASEATTLPGLGLVVNVPKLALNPWRAVFEPGRENANTAQETSAKSGLGVLDFLTLECDQLDLGGFMLNQLKLHAKNTNAGLQTQILSQEARGNILWNAQDKGYLRADMDYIRLPDSKSRAKNKLSDSAPLKTSAKPVLPEIELNAKSFYFGSHSLGALHLAAKNQGETWEISDIALNSPHAHLSGAGRWAGGQTLFALSLDSNNFGDALTQIGYSNVLQAGHAKFKADISWPGSPLDFNVPALKGEMSVLLEKGAFKNLNIGIVRFLGLLDLQSLSRRIALDFKDVLSDGFAFDRMEGNLTLQNAALQLAPIKLTHPSLSMLLEGSIHLDTETQMLRISAQPKLSETVALGAAAATGAVNPLLGVVTYVAQKLLDDPVEKLFTANYTVTGTWKNPIVKKNQEVAPTSNNGNDDFHQLK